MTYMNFCAAIRLIAPSDLCRSRRHPGSTRNGLEAAGVIVVVGTAIVNSARRHLPLPFHSCRRYFLHSKESFDRSVLLGPSHTPPRFGGVRESHQLIKSSDRS